MPRKDQLNSFMFEEVITMVRILECIPLKRWVTGSEIQQKLAADGIDIRRRTLQRYLKTIRENPHVFPIVANMSRKPYGFRWNTSGRGLHLPLLGSQETLLLRLCDQYLHMLLPSTILSGLKPLFADARNAADASPTASWLRKMKVVSPALPFLPPTIRDTVFEAVTEALLHDRLLFVRYNNARDHTVEANVKPLGLVQQDVRTYLVCQFEKYDNYRHLALHRIETAHMLDTRFERPEGFDLDAYTNAAPFNYAVGRSVKLEIVTDDPVLVKNLSETPFNASQTIVSSSPAAEGRPAWTITAVIEDSLLLDGWLAMRRSSILSTRKSMVAPDDGAPVKTAARLEQQIEAAQIARENPKTTLAPHQELSGAAHDELLVFNRKVVNK
ncbi:helix-turn-helix transcriptional regulator [Sutterella sp.]|uniref:helix-turn-helix transcriptional regulator n=1 Tax=Sutterella sp. TaxID=1981025 RepID=UPI003FD7FA59